MQIVGVNQPLNPNQSLIKMLPQGAFRSISAKKLAEKVARHAAEDSIEVTLHIEQILTRRNPETLTLVLAALDAYMPFVLYSDVNHYCIIIPSTLRIVSYKDGAMLGLTNCTNPKQFQNNVKMAIICYDKFYTKCDLIPQAYTGLIEERKTNPEAGRPAEQ